MGLEEITPNEVLYGSLSLILVIISIIVGLKILSKYFEFKKPTFITVGFSWIFITSAWWVSAFSFVVLALFSYRFTPFWYLFIENAFSPIAIIFWIYSYTRLVLKEDNILRDIIFWVYFIICVLFEVALITMLNINTELIGTGIEEGIFSSQLTPFAIGFQIFGLLTFVISGFSFSWQSITSADLKITWKGRFLFAAFLSFTIGSILEALFILDPISLILVRILLISANLEFYFGFFLPDDLSEFLIEKEKQLRWNQS